MSIPRPTLFILTLALCPAHARVEVAPPARNLEAAQNLPAVPTPGPDTASSDSKESREDRELRGRVMIEGAWPLR